MTQENIDMLETIVKIQDKLNAKVGMSKEEALKLSEEDRLMWIRKYGQALFVELGEVYEELGFKWWKTKEINWSNIREELIDVLHFFLSMCLLSGMEAEDIYEIYMNKNEKNFSRGDWDANK